MKGLMKSNGVFKEFARYLKFFVYRKSGRNVDDRVTCSARSVAGGGVPARDCKPGRALPAAACNLFMPPT